MSGDWSSEEKIMDTITTNESPHKDNNDNASSPQRPRSRSQSPRVERKNSPTSLLVRNLNFDLTVIEIREHFNAALGEDSIRDVYIPKDFNSGRPRGFCFIELPRKEDAVTIQGKMDGSTLGGKEIKVVFAQDKRKSAQQMRGRDDLNGRRNSNNSSSYRGDDHRRNGGNRSFDPRGRGRDERGGREREDREDRRRRSRSRSPRRR